MRLIDADKLRKDEIARCHCVPCVGSNDNNYKDLDEVLNEAPTVDAVEVVRCKDCVFWNTDKKGFSDECVCRRFSVLNVCDKYTLPTDFCSYGERREK